MPVDTFHRSGDEDRTTTDWGSSAPEVVKRVVLALGPEPLENARHLLAPVPLPSEGASLPQEPDTPDSATNLVIEVMGARPASLFTVAEILTAKVRAALRFPRVWGRAFAEEAFWLPLPHSVYSALPNDEFPLNGAAFSWALSQLALQNAEAIREIEGYRREIERRFAPLGWSVVLRETPDTALARAARLNRIKARFARSVEMRLLAQGRPFPARHVWRAAYALGLVWGEMDLFHWHESLSGHRLFTLSSLGQPGYFLPERAAEGEGIPGLSLGFELPTAPAPLETYDRMAVALNYLRHQLGGRPTASNGAELDAECLDTDRESLEEAVDEMHQAGISPGSPEAAHYF